MDLGKIRIQVDYDYEIYNHLSGHDVIKNDIKP